jgi:hypothetical protein
MMAEPFHSAMIDVWRVQTAEGLLAHMIANDRFASLAAAEAREQNTDDRTTIEFDFARSLDDRAQIMGSLISEAAKMGLSSPRLTRGDVDWDMVEANRRFLRGSVDRERPSSVGELSTVAMELATRGNPEAEGMADVLRRYQPIESDVIHARLRLTQGRLGEAAAVLRRAFIGYRTNPWPEPRVMAAATEMAVDISGRDRALAGALQDALSRPFAVDLQHDNRVAARVLTAYRHAGCGAETLTALRDLEPIAPWDARFLVLRVECYGKAGLSALQDDALRELERFESMQAPPIIPQQQTGNRQ